MRAVPVTKLPTLLMSVIAASPSQPVVVEELRLRVQLFLEDVHVLVLDDVGDLALRIEQVAELARPHRADFHALRVQPLAHPLDAEGALLDDATLAWAIAEVLGDWIELVFRDVPRAPVE